MTFSIGHRLFASVLLALLAVAASAVLLLRHNVLASFGDYAVGIELDRLDELSTALTRQYRGAGGWTFIATDDRAGWIAGELTRLQRLRANGLAAAPAPPAAPSPPAAPRAPAIATAPAAVSTASTTSTTSTAAAAAAVAPLAQPAPPALPEPPAPPMPPLPPPPAPDLLERGPPPAPDDALPLARRITLLSADDRYLAGRRPGTAPLARRALSVDGRTVGWLAVARGARPSDAMAYAFLAQLQSSLWLIVAVAVALSAVAATLLARHFRRPVRALAAGAQQLAEGRFDVRLDGRRSDELGDLARHFNTLAAQLGSAESARRQWVADTSHELRTPLAVLRAQLEALQDGVRSATPQTLDAMLRQVLALNKLIDELYALARADVGALDCRPVPLDLWALAREHARGFEERLAAAGLTLTVGAAPGPTTVLADPDRMGQVLDNLLENSLRYTASGGGVTLHGAHDGADWLLHLDDSAPGVPDAALAHLGERFYRVDASRSRAHGGAGLGLALCKRLLEAQGGQLSFAHAPGGGLRATIRMPTQ